MSPQAGFKQLNHVQVSSTYTQPSGVNVYHVITVSPNVQTTTTTTTTTSIISIIIIVIIIIVVIIIIINVT